MTLPGLPDAFYWTDESWGPALRCRPLGAVAAHCFTTRGLDVSPTGPVEPLRDAVARAMCRWPRRCTAAR